MLHLIILILLALPALSLADDWGALATISSTMGVNDGKLCLGEASRGDIGCPAYAPTVSPTGTLTTTAISLTTSGTNWGYLGSNASYLPNLNSNAISTTNISVTNINGVSVNALGGGGGGSVYDSGWFSVNRSTQYILDHALGGVPDIVQVYWSNTADGSGDVTLIGNTTYGAANTLINRINSTSIGIFTGPSYLTYLRNPSGTYTAPATGYHKVIAIKYNGGSGSGGGSGTPTGAVMAFDLAACPSGWSEYLPARGRFLRGIDSTGATDPDGIRTPGSVQADILASHLHSVDPPDTATSSDSHGHTVPKGPSGGWGGDSSNPALQVSWGLSTGTVATNSSTHAHTVDIPAFNSAATGGAETRPKNVAVLYCRKD